MFGVSLAVLFLLLWVVPGLNVWSLTAIYLDEIRVLSQNPGLPAVQDQKPRLLILLAMVHFLFFIMSYCFTGGYISLLNMPILEEAPDTKEKLLTVLRTGRLRACVWINSFGNKSRSTHISQLRAAVRKWSPLIADSFNTCAERTRQGEAVFFTSMHIRQCIRASIPGTS
ncbi:hypothetical protein MRX96_026317 [Rhipicephalus microplus]